LVLEQVNIRNPMEEQGVGSRQIPEDIDTLTREVPGFKVE
jgi:hypothetical protein